jgi:glutamate--cysteine ligase
MPFDTKAPITSKAELIAYLEQGCKPKADWRVGVEYEKFAYRRSTITPIDYTDVSKLFTQLEKFGWQPLYENDKVIALLRKHASVTLEPGGQVELSGAAVADVHTCAREVDKYLEDLQQAAPHMQFLGHGFQPIVTLQDTPQMPKERYKIMRAYMPKVGKLGLEMMHRTCTVQANMDFSSEADMVKKFRVSLALQPVVTALFANSPFKEGKPNGYLSFRSHIWTDTDSARCGIPAFAFEDSMGFERYVDYALNVPMYFVKRGGQYIDASGQSFRDFLQGQLPALPGETPLLSDFTDHLTTLFPEVRLKHYLEMRGADSGPRAHVLALPALFVGLLYDHNALDAAYDFIKNWTYREIEDMRNRVPQSALQTPFRNSTVQDIARHMLSWAEGGLISRALGEEKYLDFLHYIVDSGRCPAQELLENYHTRWDQDVTKIFKAAA